MKKSNLFFAVVAFTTLNFQLVIFNCHAQYTKLSDFTLLSNGSHPNGSLFSDGTFLYGVASQGGTSDWVTIFKIMPDGTGFVKLLDFSGTANGSFARGSLISDGTFLYGSTSMGGTSGSGLGSGTLFKIMPDGSGFSKFLDFSGATDGGNPHPLMSDGTFLYGTTYTGGASTDCLGLGCGTLFKIMSDGTGYLKLFDFISASGTGPVGALISDGTFLYGVAKKGGINNLGTLFKIMPDGTGFVKLLDFSGTANGSTPLNSLISVGGFLYGMTNQGGANNNGILFKIMPDGTGFVKMIDFSGTSNGASPTGSLISDGTFLYGMTASGGTNNNGTIFKYCITPLTFSQSPTVCSGSSLIVGSNSYSSTGTYHDTLISFHGCDSIVTTNLTVNSVDTSVSASTSILTANASPATYQWLNCNNGNAPIAGQTNQSFMATTNGSYAVIVTKNGCSDTSFCYNINTTGISENGFASSLNIYPNPCTTQTTITFTQEQKNITIKIKDALGKEIKSISFTGKQLIIDKKDMEAGTYFLQVEIEQHRIIKKLIIQ
jgi:uncharacterized repeat protein (TIGR03803 family)